MPSPPSPVRLLEVFPPLAATPTSGPETGMGPVPGGRDNEHERQARGERKPGTAFAKPGRALTQPERTLAKSPQGKNVGGRETAQV